MCVLSPASWVAAVQAVDSMAADMAGTVQVVDIGSVAVEARVAMAVVVDIGSYVYLLQLNVCYYALRQNSGSCRSYTCVDGTMASNGGNDACEKQNNSDSYSTTDSEFLLRLPLSRRRLRRRRRLPWWPLLIVHHPSPRYTNTATKETHRYSYQLSMKCMKLRKSRGVMIWLR